MVSANAIPDLENGIFRHPDVQGPLGHPLPRFDCIYDIYSLGTVLLEVGTWSTRMSFYQAGQKRDRVPQPSADNKVPLLGLTMGEKYMTALQKCLECKFEGMQHFQDTERDSADYILNLHQSFYLEVVKLLRTVICR